MDTPSVAAGPVTIKVTNTNATGITEVALIKDQRIVGEKENLAPGLDPVSFAATVASTRSTTPAQATSTSTSR